MEYQIVSVEPCRYGVLHISKDGRLLQIVEKPDFILCSDGVERVRAQDGTIIEDMARKVLPCR